MKVKATHILIAVLVLAVLAIGLWRAGNDGGEHGSREQGPLTVAEEAYYVARVHTIADTWRQLSSHMSRDDDGRIGDPDFTCIGIDAEGGRMWLESGGSILPGCEVELPSRMDWELYHSTPEGMKALPPVTRLRITGVYTSRLRPEQVHLVGTRDNQEHMAFSLGPSGLSGSSAGSGRWSGNVHYQPSKTPQAEQYQSIVVGDMDYNEATAQFGSKEPPACEPAALAENRAAWARVAKRLYLELEERVSREGCTLYHMKVECGPDYTAASAELRARRTGWFNVFRRGPNSAHAYVKIDSLGDDIWYARSAPDPHHPVRRPDSIDLEFVLSADGPILKQRQQDLLAQGREKQQETAKHESKWKMELPNGAAIEFIGVCENPSGGRQWWGPDGSPLDFVPYVNYEPYGHGREDRKIYEFAWRIHLPRQGPSGTRSTMEGAMGSYYHAVYDRYGNPLHAGLEAHGYGFDEERTATTLKIGIRLGNDPFAHATFKDISLVPGEDFGFEMTAGEPIP